MKCLFQTLGKTSHETPYYLITYKYIREYWLTKNTFFLDIICLVLTIQKVTELFLEKYYRKGIKTIIGKVVLNFFFLSDCDGK